MSATRSSRRSRDRVHAELTALLGSGGPLAAAPDGLVDFFTEEIQREIIFEYRERRPDVIDLALELRRQELGDLAAAELADVDWLAADLPSTIGSALPKCGAEPPGVRSSDRDGGAGQVPFEAPCDISCHISLRPTSGKSTRPQSSITRPPAHQLGTGGQRHGHQPGRSGLAPPVELDPTRQTGPRRAVPDGMRLTGPLDVVHRYESAGWVVLVQLAAYSAGVRPPREECGR